MNSNQDEPNTQKEVEEDNIWTKENVKLLYWMILALVVLSLMVTSVFKIEAFFYVGIVFFIVLVGLFVHIRKFEMNVVVSSKPTKSPVRNQSQLQNNGTQQLENEKEQAIAKAIAEVTEKIEAEYQVKEEESNRKELAKQKALEEAKLKAEKEFEAKWQDQEKKI